MGLGGVGWCPLLWVDPEARAEVVAALGVPFLRRVQEASEGVPSCESIQKFAPKSSWSARRPIFAGGPKRRR